MPDHAKTTHALALGAGLSAGVATYFYSFNEYPMLKAFGVGIATGLSVDAAGGYYWAWRQAGLLQKQVSELVQQANTVPPVNSDAMPAMLLTSLQSRLEKIDQLRDGAKQLLISIDRQAQERSSHLLQTSLPAITEECSTLEAIITSLQEQGDTLIDPLCLAASSFYGNMVAEFGSMDQEVGSSIVFAQHVQALETLIALLKKVASNPIDAHLKRLTSLYEALSCRQQLATHYHTLVQCVSKIDELEQQTALQCPATKDGVVFCAFGQSGSLWPLIDLRTTYLNHLKYLTETQHTIASIYNINKQQTMLTELAKGLLERIATLLDACTTRTGIINLLLQDPASPHHQELMRFEGEKRRKEEAEERAKAVNKITNAIESVQKKMQAVEERTMAAVATLEQRFNQETLKHQLSNLDTTLHKLEARLSTIESKVQTNQNNLT